MIRHALFCLATFGVMASVASADAPATSLRPMQRPVAEATQPVPVPEVTEADTTKPSLLAGILSSLRPSVRPPAPRIEKTAVAIAPRVMAPARGGGLCGDPALQGERIAPVVSRVNGCGIAEPVKLRAVDGVVLSQAATLDCTTALALKNWVQKGLRPAFGRTGGGIARLEVAAHYSCRPRNNQKGAKVSEHGKGHAIDISGVTLADGTSVTVLRDFRKSSGKPLRIAHKAACGTFGTTLGPGSDGFHEDHIHLDTARYRSGTYCR